MMRELRGEIWFSGGQGANAIKEKVTLVGIDGVGPTRRIVGRVPGSRKEICDGGRRVGKTSVGRSFDPMMSEGGEMLVSRDLEHSAEAEKFPGFIATVGGPAVGVAVIEAKIVTAVGVGMEVSKRRL